MTTDFYRSFENKHRGSRSLIKSRLEVYSPFVGQLKQLRSPCRAIDLGCGRGEWLELLSDWQVVASGVDLDEKMLIDCRELGFSVVAGDAIEHLQTLSDESLDIVSGFHIAEHLPFEKLQQLVAEALRVLRPAGVLILETPNPENIVVGTDAFYLDPTHNKPIPSQLLSFLPEHHGFYRTKILRLQEPKGLLTEREPTLFDVLNGVSPDYAVIAQKNAKSTQLEGFDLLFQRDYGLTLETLATRYESNNQQNLTLALQQAKAEIQLRVIRTAAAEEQLQSVYASHSWRITLPLRVFALSLRRICALPCHLKNRIKTLLHAVLTRGILFAVSRPKMKVWLAVRVAQYPVIDQCLRKFAMTHGMIDPSSLSHDDSHFNMRHYSLDDLSPHATQIYEELQSAIANEVRNRSG